MAHRCSRYICVVSVLTWLSAGSAGWAQLWKQFVPTSRPKVATSGDFSLSEENGPWLIMAATFSGHGAEGQARELATELRQRYGLTAYLHEMSFDFSNERPGRGLDQYGAPVRRRYQRGDRVREYAVLVGDFHSIDEPEAQQLLERVKTMQPGTLKTEEGEHTAQSLAQLREWHDQLLERLGKKRNRGPMGQAFLTRNPLLPREFFVPKGVDNFVVKMNQGVEHSLLDCPGRYSVKVATFRGNTVLQTSAVNEQAADSRWSWKKKAEDSALVEAALNAHLACAELRRHGWEAYEFHDRTESIVTIGSFSQASMRLADGREVPIPQIQKILETFGAAYDTPADPLTGIGNDPTTQRRVEEQEQQLRLRLASQQAQIVPGMNPKHIKIFKGSGTRRRVERIIPLDIYPQAIEAPKRSISSAYAE